MTQSRRGLTGQIGNAIFPEKGKTENRSLKISVMDTLGTTLFFQERVGLKIHQSKLVLMVLRLQCYFPKR